MVVLHATSQSTLLRLAWADKILIFSGARMPHVAVYKGNMKGSLLDLTGASWLLLLPALKGSDSWIEAACTVVKGCSTRIKILLIR